MKYIILFISLLITTVSKAEVKVLDLDVKRLPFQRDYFFPDESYWDYQLDLHWDVGFKRFFWDNIIEAKTRNDRFRDVSWKFDTGFKIIPELDFIYTHRSEHKLDSYSEKYPLTDSYGFRIHWITK